MHNKYLITFEKVAATEPFYIWRLNFSQGAVYQKMLNAYVNAVNIVRLLLLYFCVLQFVLPSWKCYCTNGMCETKSLSPKTDTKHNSFLDGYVFETLNVSIWKECFYVCARKCMCHSFNFNELKKTENCELSDGTSKLDSNSLKEKNGVTYYEIGRSYFDQKVNVSHKIVSLVVENAERRKAYIVKRWMNRKRA